MSTYGERLRKYINDRKISVRKLSMETGINRVLLQKYLSGERLSKNIEEVYRISDCLMLSPEKKEDLAEGYNRTRYGEKKYEDFLKIQEMLCGLVNYRMQPSAAPSAGMDQSPVIGAAAMPESRIDTQQGCKACIGSMEVENALRAILQRQTQTGQNRTLQLICQPEAGNLLKTVLSVCAGENINMEVEQIVCLNEDSPDGDNNIQTVYGLLPMLFGGIDYQSFYYYDRKESHINTMSLLPILILAGDIAMVCSCKMDEALLFFQKESVDFYRSQFQHIKSRTNLLIRHYKDDVGEWATYLKNFMTDLAVAEICIGATPCVTYSLDETILSECLCLEPVGKESLMSIFAKNRDTFTQASLKKAPVNLFSEKGLRHFMETGRSNEYPDDWYHPITLPNRLLMLERMIFMAENGYMNYIMANPDILPLDENLLIYVNENVVFHYHQTNQINQYFSVNEQGVRRSFQEFIGFAEENGWLFHREETIRKMQELLQEYKDKFAL